MNLRPTRVGAWRLAVVAVVAVLAVVFATRGTSSPPPTVPTSTQPTSWQLPKLSGSGTVKLADLRGHPVVLDFFASWCTACRGELPGTVALSHQLAGRVTFVGVNSMETGDGLAMAQQYGATAWPLVRDVGGTAASGLHDALGGEGMPITAFYDSNGKVLKLVLGAISEDDLRARIQSLYGITA